LYFLYRYNIWHKIVYVKSDTCEIGCVLCLTHVLAEPFDMNNFCRNSVSHFVLLSYICHYQQCKFFTCVVMETLLSSYPCLCQQYRTSLYDVTYPIFVSEFNETLIFSTDSNWSSQYQISRKLHPARAEFMHLERRTDVTKLTGAFRDFANAPNQRKNSVMRSNNHRCHGNATICFLHVIELYVADSLK
jgi:hypothetical protein